ncbi:MULTISPECIES: DUF1810 domain-containing protein [Rhizobium]|uniref:DUF1810 domain-containing protein n=1 Tax=Rhizobium leguminosarum bv. viciae TaxID=387 RepID=A0A8G2MT90_RHILV|nr:DUF1810 domain-containing protein [Rhizobium leguminosarum]NKK08522.1 DUF1810 family protein [Rhizobium leguminosarum bv. viciae]NKK22271.1 DUF1810 family protein [Rhizobium leguminosarum bv. viciae]TBF64663.1 DUF1810 domain-containing protein [Rhizobium leguminosarum]TBG49761.1 DUF1810 domain-containing protein [Rhizobium leguminosarum]TBG55982.1 DUF1810 domain-containing protein [Rhizobium leguminosarum]
MAGDIDYKLHRFIDAQNGIYERALSELKAGRKTSHWMWFVFPQIAGLGTSAMAEKYAIRSAEEAAAYLADPILSSRLLRCVEAILSVDGRSTHEILGSPDDLKLRSSMTLFAAISDHGSPFHQVIDHFYQGKFDERTIEILSANTD